MMLRSSTFFAVAGITVLLSAPVGAQSFDCDKASYADERTICASSRLSQLDEQLDDVFAVVTDSVSRRQRGPLRREEDAWVASRRHCGGDEQCIALSYRSRIEQLNAMLSNTDRNETPASSSPPPRQAEQRRAIGAVPGRAMTESRPTVPVNRDETVSVDRQETVTIDRQEIPSRPAASAKREEAPTPPPRHKVRVQHHEAAPATAATASAEPAPAPAKQVAAPKRAAAAAPQEKKPQRNATAAAVATSAAPTSAEKKPPPSAPAAAPAPPPAATASVEPEVAPAPRSGSSSRSNVQWQSTLPLTPGR